MAMIKLSTFSSLGWAYFTLAVLEVLELFGQQKVWGYKTYYEAINVFSPLKLDSSISEMSQML